MFCFAPSLLLVLEFVCACASVAFVPKSCMPTKVNRRPYLHLVTFLDAKAARKKKKPNKAPPKVGGGFGGKYTSRGVAGSPTTSNKRVDDDFVAFPALDTDIKETLIPSANESFCGALPGEIYDRIEQIYGFPNFNYESSPPSLQEPSDEISAEGASDVSSLEDMLNLSPKKDSPPLPSLIGSEVKRSAPSSDIADLIASATGGESSKTRGRQQEVVVPSISNLSAFDKFRILHVDPMVLAIDDFFTEEECDRYVKLANIKTARTKDGGGNDAPLMSRSKTVGKDALAKAQRTSTTWFHSFRSAPELVAKGSRLLGLEGIDHWEEPQTVRYQRSEKYTWHLDALAPSATLPSRGGQRTATLLVYLTDLSESDGGGTLFRDLGGPHGPLKMRPKKGSALLFFPAAGGVANVPFDIRTLHAGEAVAAGAPTDKWIAQMWLRHGTYTPNAPPGNTHEAARDSIDLFCKA